ncbi:PaaI family thioesterase [Neobacillus sp. NRS-1170]|uniref:PaaI family thioesterase n=1 Tax=Neobacillus sp. NRS-1170 TaxID=3233898 RepID=UPI003D2ADF1E
MEELMNILQQFGYSKHIGIQVSHLEEGNVELELPISRSILNYNQKVHGGAIAGLLDVVIGMTIHTLYGKPMVTVNLNISYLASAPENETLTATAKILNSGYNIVTGEAEVRDSHGVLVSKAVGTYKIINK